MPELAHSLTSAAPWVGVVLLGLIFLANALGVLDQSVAVSEVVGAGLSKASAERMVAAGRMLQLTATPCLFINSVRPYAAVLLALFLIGATTTAHAFWRAPPHEQDRQRANFLKNLAIVGGLLLAAGWRS